MSEFGRVLAALGAPGAEELVLATVVSVEGSNYRRAGARMVVAASADRAVVGSISGGCLEAEVVAIARAVLASGRPRLVCFDHTDDDTEWGWGLGCPGSVEVFVEPAAGAGAYVAAAHAARIDRAPVVVALALEGRHVGARLVMHHGGRRSGTLGDAATDHAIAGLVAGGRPTVVVAAGGRVFVETLEPPLRLLVCGAGPGAAALAEFGRRLGWAVEADGGAAGVDRHTYVVVMSHNFERDKDYLASFLTTPAPYLGVLGPRPRLDRLLAALRADGLDLDDAALGRVHGPAGLDLGAEGPEEIAWSIASQILAVHNRTRSR